MIPPLAEAKAIPSRPTCNSMISDTLFAAQVSNSETFIRREAWAISGVLGLTPEQNSLIPLPVPVDSISGERDPGFDRAKFSATTLAKGYTVEEPTA